jgi:predicted RNase H-like HicB family nuclease
VTVHDQVLRAAIALCRSRGGWRFRAVEIVRALPHLDAGTVRTHIVSRCCVNAPENHPHRWDYFERVSRGLYEVRSAHRRPTHTLAERAPHYRGGSERAAVRETVHAVVRRSAAWFTAECLELAVVAQGRSLDELASNLQQAIELHLEGEHASALGLVESPRLSITYELPARTR